MRSLFRIFLLICLCTGGALSALALESAEIECSSDDDCPEDTECMPTPCPAMACDPDDEGCEPVECPSYCASTQTDIPDVLTCEIDEDCPAYFSCEEVELSCPSTPTTVGCPPCACPDCPPGEECEPCECPPCDEPEPIDDEECEPETVKMCRFEAVDCSDNADSCDPGFECQEMQECQSSGSAGSPPSAGGASTDCACPDCAPGEECPPCECDDDEGGSEIPTDPIELPDEDCEVTGAICVPEEVECDDANDCLEGWECVESQSISVEEACACTICAPCPPCDEGEECEPCPECPPCDCDDVDPPSEESTSLCLPEGWSDLMNSGWVGGDDVLIEDGTNSTGPNANPEDPDPSEENSGNGASKEGGAESSGGGCSASSKSSADVFFSLALILSGAVLLRRRFTCQT